MLSIILYFIGGLIVLIVGAELLVRGSSRLAAAFGVSPLVIGLTIVALGTASPEIAVSLQAAVSGQGDITIGNVIGSNIFNILGILGVTALVRPLAVSAPILSSDLWWMLGLSFALFPLMRSRAVITRLEGAVLLLAYGTYLGLAAFVG